MELDELRVLNTLAFQEVAHLSRDNTFRIESELEQMSGLAQQLDELAAKMKRKNPYAESDRREKVQRAAGGRGGAAAGLRAGAGIADERGQQAGARRHGQV